MNESFIEKIIEAIILLILFSISLYFLWNWLMPNIFYLNEITFLQAGGLILLSRCLFGVHKWI
jgi:hypothetical protein